MTFNFGAQPFKHTPKSGYIALCQAPKNCVSNSEARSGGRAESKAPVKMNNAPQAIIIEVSLFGAYVMNIWSFLKNFYVEIIVSLPEN